MTAKVHDADLCKEIKRLEKRVAELERDRYCRGHGYYVWPYYPQPWRPTPFWYGTTTGNTTYTIGTTTGTDITIG